MIKLMLLTTLLLPAQYVSPDGRIDWDRMYQEDRQRKFEIETERRQNEMESQRRWDQLQQEQRMQDLENQQRRLRERSW
jgi:hypothetical protein